MKTTLCILVSLALLMLFAAGTYAQQPTSIYAVGVSFNPGATPQIAGTGLYARRVADTGTYLFTVVDALPTTVQPLAVTTQFGAGIAQRIVTLGKVSIYVPTSAGVSYNGTNTGWAWTTGALASITIKDSWKIMPHARLLKSSVSNGTGYQVIVGTLFGWGQ